MTQPPGRLTGRTHSLPAVITELLNDWSSTGAGVYSPSYRGGRWRSNAGRVPVGLKIWIVLSLGLKQSVTAWSLRPEPAS
jgi:hypothetical protein